MEAIAKLLFVPNPHSYLHKHTGISIHDIGGDKVIKAFNIAMKESKQTFLYLDRLFSIDSGKKRLNTLFSRLQKA